MMYKIKHIAILLISLIVVPLSVFAADEVSFTASAPSTVVAGRQFQVSFTVNKQGKDMRAPEFADFDVLAGPFTSTSVSWVNGKHSYEETYTYTLMADKEGSFTIQPATITVSGKTYQSNGLKIKVLPPDQQQNNAGQSSAQGQASQPTGSVVSSENLFVRTIVDKKNVYEQECIVLSYRLYTLVDVSQLTPNTKIPDFEGFMKQEVDLGNNNQLELEHYNGRNYQAITLFQTLLYPQHSGDIQIPAASFEAIVRVRNQSPVRSMFDFFDTYTNVSKPLNAPAVTIHVNPLPAGKPAAYLGGVGQFNLASTISTTELKTNEAVTLTLNIKGKGNLKMIKTPAVDFPEGFELYDPKVTNNFKTTAQGISGDKKIEYLAIARAGGEYSIPPIEFAYFDTKDKTYKTLRTPTYTIHVEKTAVEESESAASVYVPNKEDIKSLNSDIRYINLSEPEYAAKPAITIGSMKFWLLYLVPLLLSIILFALFHKQIRDNADIRKVRYRKANKMVQKRLKTAAQYMKTGDKAHFYEEILKASWTYLSDKLSIPTSELNKENVAETLRSHGANDELIDTFKSVLSDAEFAQYAPVQSDHDMQDLYNKTSDMIEEMEKVVK